MPPINPYSLARTMVHPLARMLPYNRLQEQAYRLGEKFPPGLRGYAPKWECVSLLLAARATQQMRVSLERDFHLLAIAGRAIAEGGGAGNYRAQFYDETRQVRLAGRGVAFANLGGAAAGAGVFFLREPYRFPQLDSHVLCVIQNTVALPNTIQIVLYGVCLPPPEVS